MELLPLSRTQSASNRRSWKTGWYWLDTCDGRERGWPQCGSGWTSLRWSLSVPLRRRTTLTGEAAACNLTHRHFPGFVAAQRSAPPLNPRVYRSRPRSGLGDRPSGTWSARRAPTVIKAVATTHSPLQRRPRHWPPPGRRREGADTMARSGPHRRGDREGHGPGGHQRTRPPRRRSTPGRMGHRPHRRRPCWPDGQLEPKSSR